MRKTVFLTPMIRTATSMLLGILAYAICIPGCVPPQEGETYTTAVPDYKDPVTIRILDLKDRMASDSLIAFLSHENPAYRYLAAEAFASIRDTLAISALAACLDDPFELPRFASAYALGQIGSPRAEQDLISAFRQYDSTNVNNRSNAAILEAIGKCGSQASLIHMATVRTYRPTDTLLLLGQARGIYRFGLRNITASEGTSRMVTLATDPQFPASVRIIAANYLFRNTSLDLGSYTSILIAAFEREKDARIRMCLATALGKTRSTEALRTIGKALAEDPDYRVKCNLIKGLTAFNYTQVEDMIYGALRDNNLHVARMAADYLVENGNQQDALYYRSLSKGQYHWMVKAILYEAANRHLPGYFAITKANMQNELIALYNKSGNPYEKGFLLKAIAREPKNFEFIWGKAREEKSLALKTQAMEALQQIALDPDLPKTYSQVALNNRRRQFANVFLEAIKSGNDAWVAIAASVLNNKDAGLREFVSGEVAVLKETRNALSLPRQIEAHIALSECIAAIEGSEYTPDPPRYNHPVDWSVFRSLADTVAIEIVTTKGSILVDVYRKMAPGTVVNFVNLIRDGFYNNKIVHRVVPNFVIQDGCPRGDGYGSLDYTIRSELGPEYYDDEGYIGMASAGNHTECTQWFITHSPTPHLDGRYTIFGKVVSGMNVVHAISIGEKIERIQIVNEVL